MFLRIYNKFGKYDTEYGLIDLGDITYDDYIAIIKYALSIADNRINIEQYGCHEV